VLLQIKDVAELGPETYGQRSSKLKEILALPAAYIKGADALKRSKSTYQRRRISFSVHDFHQLVQRIETMAKAGAEIKPEDFYPEVKKHRGKSRDLPISDVALRTAIENHLAIRLEANPSVKKTDPLFLTQKGGPCSPNTLQEHVALIQRHWAGIERASSHSGRQTLMTNIIHEQKKSVKVAQKNRWPCVSHNNAHLQRTSRGVTEGSVAGCRVQICWLVQQTNKLWSALIINVQTPPECLPAKLKFSAHL